MLKIGAKFKANIKINNRRTYFYVPNDFKSNLLNILAAVTVISIFLIYLE